MSDSLQVLVEWPVEERPLPTHDTKKLETRQLENSLVTLFPLITAISQTSL